MEKTARYLSLFTRVKMIMFGPNFEALRFCQTFFKLLVNFGSSFAKVQQKLIRSFAQVWEKFVKTLAKFGPSIIIFTRAGEGFYTLLLQQNTNFAYLGVASQGKSYRE